MKRIGAAAEDTAVLAKRARHRIWTWCRLKNEFFDDPLWRVVAEATGLPLFQVQAFVGRLESLANKSTPRGFVGEFRPAEFGAATGMSAEHAARIFAALEHPDVAWLDQDHVASFYARNPDKEDETAAERDRRRKARRYICTKIDKKRERGDIDADQRDSVVAWVYAIDDEELFALKKKLAAGVALEAALSTSHAGHAVASRDSVAATPRAEQTTSEQRIVDNSGTVASGEAAGLFDEELGVGTNDPQAQARRWMEIEGRRIAIARMADEQPGKVDMLLERWRDQVLEGDAIALMTVLIECDRLALVGPTFHVAVSQRCDQARRRAQLAADKQQGLPLGGIQRLKSA